MKYVNAENIKPGMILVYSCGATMTWHEFYQVIKIKKSKVYLGAPQAAAEGNQEGYQWVNGPSQNPEVTKHAKLVRGEVRLCGEPGQKDWQGKDTSWKVDHYWSRLCEAEIGKRYFFHGD